MGRLIYLTGPVRSGKSRRAVTLGQTWGQDTVFVATWAPSPDVEMHQRVARHQSERPAWRVVEAPADLPSALTALHPPPTGVIVDCLTLWTSARLEQDDEAIVAEWQRFLDFTQDCPWPTVVVGNEIGWAPVPDLPILRRYRDLVGLLAQATTAVAHEAWLYVAGCPLSLKST